MTTRTRLSMPIRRWTALVGGLALLATLLTGLAPATSASAAVGSNFQAGNIISDQNFYNPNALSEAQIQAFFQAKSCAPRDAVPCLRDYRQTTVTKPAQGSGHCSAYQGAANESAARILWKVSQACGISPAVLLVLMQKEQSLITNPSSYGYERAMGWGCPDTAPCNAEYFGYYNQVYKSAWQFRQYTLTASKWRYKIGNVAIQYHPLASCGSSTVRIVNQATANLYNYTPYQPNPAALGNLYGTGDGCSSYGNRNFWRIYSDWFGSPQDPIGTPVGEIKQIWTTPNKILLWGWAADLDVPTTALQIHIVVDGVWTVLTADQSNTTSEALWPGTGIRHGFGGEIIVPPGARSICVYAVNQAQGANLTLGCSTQIVPDGSPIGEIKEVWGGVNTISTWGWAGDPDAQTQTTEIQVRVDGTSWTVAKADQAYPGLDQLLPDSPANHGFGLTIPAAPGSHEVCIFAINRNLGSNTTLGCQTVTALSGTPFGALKDLYPVPGGVALWGWAADPDIPTSAAPVHIRIDGTSWAVMSANQPYTPGAPFRGASANLGFGGTLPLSAGRHEVCVFGANTGPGSTATFGCRTVTVPGGSPLGVMNQVWGASGAINFWGWALDPDTADPIDLHVLIDGVWTVVKADAPNSAVGLNFPAYGSGHGFGASIPATSGRHSMCVYAINRGAGSNLTLWCSTVVVP